MRLVATESGASRTCLADGTGTRSSQAGKIGFGFLVVNSTWYSPTTFTPSVSASWARISPAAPMESLRKSQSDTSLYALASMVEPSWNLTPFLRVTRHVSSLTGSHFSAIRPFRSAVLPTWSTNGSATLMNTQRSGSWNLAGSAMDGSAVETMVSGLLGAGAEQALSTSEPTTRTATNKTILLAIQCIGKKT